MDRLIAGTRLLPADQSSSSAGQVAARRQQRATTRSYDGLCSEGIAHPEVYRPDYLPPTGSGSGRGAVADGTPKAASRAVAEWSTPSSSSASCRSWSGPTHMFMTGVRGAGMTTFFQNDNDDSSRSHQYIILTALNFPLAFRRINTLRPAAMFFASPLSADVWRVEQAHRAARSAWTSQTYPLHDTSYVIARFHYVMAPGTLFALLAGSSTRTRRRQAEDEETLGKVHLDRRRSRWTSFSSRCSSWVFGVRVACSTPQRPTN